MTPSIRPPVAAVPALNNNASSAPAKPAAAGSSFAEQLQAQQVKPPLPADAGPEPTTLSAAPPPARSTASLVRPTPAR